MAVYTTWRALQKLMKGQLNAQDTINNALDQLDKCAPYIVASVELDVTATGNTLIYSVPTGKRFYPVMTIIRSSTLSAPSGTPTIAVGSNSSSYDNLVTGTSMDLDTAGDYVPVSHVPTSIGVKSSYAAGTPIFCRVSVAGGGTTYKVKVDLIGILL